MDKPKVEPLLALIFGVEQVFLSLVLRHGSPLAISDLVAPDVKCLDQVEQDNIKTSNTEQDLVAPAIKRRVLLSVDVRRYDVS